jgi:mono/diheme cytochrome c family protein
MRLSLARLAMAATAFACSPVLAAQVATPEEGHQVARRLCSECHLLGIERGRSLHDNAPTFQKIAETPGMTAAAFRLTFNRWHQEMPNVVLADEELDSIFMYIQSLRTSR